MWWTKIIEALIFYDYMVFVIIVEIARQINYPVFGISSFFIWFPYGVVRELFPNKQIKNVGIFYNFTEMVEKLIPVTYVIFLNNVFVLYFSGVIHLRYQNMILGNPFRINAIIGLQG